MKRDRASNVRLGQNSAAGLRGAAAELSQDNRLEAWWNAKHLDPNHPLRKRLQKFADLGANLDFIFAACRMLALANVMQLKMRTVKRGLRDRKRRWTKEFRALFVSHPGGQLRLTALAQIYTQNVIRATCLNLKQQGLLGSDEISDEQVKWIKQEAVRPLADMDGFPEDWDAAVNGLSDEGHNLLEAVGLTRLTSNSEDWLRQSMEMMRSFYWDSGDRNRRIKSRDDAGTIFLLFVTEHLREKTATKTRKGKPHFRLAFTLMRSLQGKLNRKVARPDISAMVRIKRLKRQWPQWQMEMRRCEQMFQGHNIN